MPGSARDFDFILGRWSVHNRKLVDVTDPACDEWVEFDASDGPTWPQSFSYDAGRTWALNWTMRLTRR